MVWKDIGFFLFLFNCLNYVCKSPGKEPNPVLSMQMGMRGNWAMAKFKSEVVYLELSYYLESITICKQALNIPNRKKKEERKNKEKMLKK